jgi:hypothetical protein
MSDQDLIDQITTSAHRTDHIELNPTVLITAGRRRIRRRRFATAALSLAVVGAAVLTGVHMTAGAEQPPVAASPSVSVTLDGDPIQTYYALVLRHLGAAGTGLARVEATMNRTSYTLTAALPQRGGLAILRVTGPTTRATPGLDPTRQVTVFVDPDPCTIEGHPITLGKCTVVEANGQSVRVAQRDERAYFAGLLRTDGVDVQLQVDKDANTISVGGTVEDIGLDNLIALVTDPSLPPPA